MSDAPQHEAHRRPHTPPKADPFMEFDLSAEIHRLHAETTWNTGQNARTLIKYDDFRVVLIALAVVALVQDLRHGSDDGDDAGHRHRPALRHAVGSLGHHRPDPRRRQRAGALPRP